MNDTLLQYYKNLLILQYRIKDKAQAHIEALLTPAIIYDLMREVENGYNIETAVGIQLDVLATYVGASRTIPGYEFDRTYWGIADYEETETSDIVGIIDYDQTPLPDALMLDYESDSYPSSSMIDEELRIIIKLKIIQNNSNYSVKDIDLLIDMFFGSDILFTDNKDMSVEYIFDSTVEDLIEMAKSQDMLPKPMGVSLLLTYTPDIENIYGMLNYSSEEVPTFLQGFVDYSSDPFGGMLSY